MAFDTTSFSQDGLALLAQVASSQAALKLKHVYVDSEHHDTEDFEEGPAWWASETSTITNVKVDPEVTAASVLESEAHIRVGLSLHSGVSAAQTIKTVVLTACGVEPGHPENETTEVTLCGISSDIGLQVDTTGGTRNSIDIHFAFSNTESIYLQDGSTADFVTYQDLERYVTCHALGDVTSGDDQDIRGVKSFKNNVHMIHGYTSLLASDVENGYYTLQLTGQKLGVDNIQPQISVGYNATRTRNEITFISGGTGTDWTIYQGVLAPTGNNAVIGSTDNPVKKIYALSLGDGYNYADTVYCDSVHCYAIRTDALISNAEGEVTVMTDLTPDTDIEWDVGTEEKRFKSLHAKDIYGTLHGSIGTSVGDTTIYGNVTVTGVISGRSDSAKMLGSSLIMPVGSIFLAIIAKNDAIEHHENASGFDYLTIGELVTNNNDDPGWYSVYVMDSVGTTFATSATGLKLAVSGEYRLMNDAHYQSNLIGSCVVAMVMRWS